VKPRCCASHSSASWRNGVPELACSAMRKSRCASRLIIPTFSPGKASSTPAP
jgi:hypothetical protein